MSKTRTGTELGPPIPGGAIDDGGTPDTDPETYDGVFSGVLRGFTPTNYPRGSDTNDPVVTPYLTAGGRRNLNAATIAGVPSVTSHAPAGIGWIPSSAWTSATWDGTPYDVTGKSKAQICNWVFPTSNTMRGLRQLYEAAPPFANPVNPTVGEIDLWNIKVINHFRALFGIGPITPSLRLYAEAQWSTERRWTNKWNSYASNGTLPYGPCPNSNPHCGATFLPSTADQVGNIQNFGWYSSGLLPTSSVRESVAEALGGVNTNIPWSIKLARVIAVFLCYEGLVGHTGPFLRRQKIGMIFHDIEDGTTQVRFKFGGTYTAFAGS